MKTTLLTLCVSMLLVSTALAVEDNPYPSPWRNNGTYGDQAVGKLGYGAKNLFLGWTELFTEPIGSETPFVSIGQGLGNTVMDTVGGFLHVLTFPVTGIDVPLPENGVNFLEENI